jgi:uncharacterized protein (TIGR02452 family)
MDLVAEARAVLATIARGAYTTPSGKTVPLRAAIDAAVAGTECHLPHEVAANEAGLAAARPISTVIEVTSETTAAAGRRLVQREGEERVAALNFASALSVCGGFLRGARAQEEDLARVSALHACLERQRAYYDVNLALGSHLYTDAMIHSPAVPFFRDEELVPLEAPFALSILTAPAPCAFQLTGPERARLRPTLDARAARILAVAAHHGHRVLVLGAWGCGAFRNDPDAVAGAFAAALASPRLRGAFDRVVFAVHDPAGTNLAPFERRFGRARPAAAR